MSAKLRPHLRSRAIRADRGFTLIELVIAITLSLMIGGVIVAGLITSLNVASSTSAQISDSTDAGLISSFLVRDAQSAGGIDPSTALADSTLGVSTDAADPVGIACTPAPAAVKVRFSWVDRSSSPEVRFVVTYASAIDPDNSVKTQFIRRVCRDDGSTVTSTDVVLGRDILSASVTCAPVTAFCAGHPDTVTMTVTGRGTRAPLVSIMTASLRSDASQLTIIGPVSLQDGQLGVPYPTIFLATIGASAPTTWSMTGAPTGIAIDAAGVISGTPDLAAAAKLYTITITATDASLATTTKVYTVFIHAPPVAVGENYSTNEDTVLAIAAPGLLANDSSPEGTPITAVLYSGVANGSVTLNANGSFTYTPKPNFSGTDAFSYKVTDGSASSNIVAVAITINAVNDAPVNGVPVGQETPRNIPLIFWASSNGISVSDVDAGTAQVRLTATNGTVTVLFASGLTFSVGDGFLDTTMTFTGTIANINAALGYVTFWPSSDFVGSGRLDIVTSDLGATGGGGPMTDSDSVTINVTSLGIFTDHLNIVAPSLPVAPGTGSSYSWPADYTVAASGWGIWDDYDGFRFVYRQMTGDVSLTARVQAETVTAGPHTDISKAGVMFRQGLTERTMDAMMGITKAKGSEFLYRAADATGLPNSNCVTPWISSCTASASGTDALAPPYWVRITRRGNQIMGETSPNGTTWTQRGTTQTIAMGSTIYVGLAASAVYQLDTALVQGNKINTADFDNVAISTPPTALADSYSVNENTTLTIPAVSGVLANDSDPEGNGLAANVASSTAGLTLNQDGSFTYVPPANFFGTASFTYMANDGIFNSAAATVTIRVDPINATPSFTKGADQSIGSNLGPQTIAGWATAISQGGADTGQLVDFVVTNNNPALFTVQPAVSATGTLTYASATNVSGIATVSVTIHDNGGTTNGAIDTSAVQTFTIFVNNPPVVTASGGTLAYTENATMVLDPALTVTDTDGPNLAAANVTMTGAYANGQDTLAFVNQNGITGTWTPATGVLALSGASTVANYQAALRSITYTNTSDNPSTATRTVTFDASDGLLTSNTSSRTITITAVGDAAVITTTVGPLAYTENAVPALDAGITVTDADSPNLTSLSVTITAYVIGQDTLAFVDQNGITGVWSPATGVLSLSGTSTVANYQIALRTITYTNSSDAPNTTARSVSFVGSDGTLTSNTATRSITITAVNDAPVNSVPAGQVTGRNITEVFSTANGNLISIADVDASSGAMRVQLVGTSGTITLSGTSGLTFTVGDGLADPTMTFSGTTTNVNLALAGLSFIPTNNFNGAANLQIVTNDQGSTGTGGAKSDTDNIAIIVDNAPIVTTSVTTMTYVENAVATAVDLGLTVTDSDNANLVAATVTITTGYVSGQDSLVYVTISGITGTWDAVTGTLTMSGSATVANYQAALRTVKFTSSSNNPAPSRAVAFVVGDGFRNSNTASRSIAITPVNDAPVVTPTGGAMAYTENGTTLLDPTITASDIDSATLASATVRMTTNYVSAQDILAFVPQNGISATWTAATGILALTGSATVADYQTALRSITYNNLSDNPTTTTRTVSFVINDGFLPSVATTRTINLAAVNDAPVNGVPGGTQTTPKNVSLVFLASTSNLISISDADAGASQVQVQLVATSGTSTLFRTTGLAFTVGNGTNNATMTFTGTIANVNAALAGMRFNPTAGFVGTGTLRIVTNDQGFTGSGGAQTDSDTIQIFVT